MNENKICSKCKLSKPLSEFYAKNRKLKDGTIIKALDSRCKTCDNEKRYLAQTSTPELLAKYKERSNARRKKSYLLNKEKQDRRAKAWYEDLKASGNFKNTWLYNKYKIRLVDYLKMLKDQNYSCAICQITEEEYGKALHIDHNHDNGKTRGLLCHICNLSLGKPNDKILDLPITQEYLLKGL